MRAHEKLMRMFKNLKAPDDNIASVPVQTIQIKSKSLFSAECDAIFSHLRVDNNVVLFFVT